MKEMLWNPEQFEVRCRVCGKVFLTNRKNILPDIAKVCMQCMPETVNLDLFYGSENLAVNKALGYPKFKG